MHTVSGEPVEIIDANKSGMSIFKVFGLLSGKPCHWTTEGKFRMDGVDDPRDLAGPPSPQRNRER